MPLVFAMLIKKKTRRCRPYDRTDFAGCYAGAKAKRQRLAPPAMSGLYAKTERIAKAGGVLVLPLCGFPPDRAGGAGGRHLLLAGGADFMKQENVKILKYAAVFAVTLIAFWLLLFLSALIPNSAIRSNMEQSADTYKELSTYEFVNGNKFNSVADHYADALWLNIAWNMGEGNSLKSVIQTDYYNGEGLGENAGLYLTITEGKAPNTDYTRYWHGTAMFIRLGHLFTDVEGVKLIGLITFLLLAGLSLVILVQKKHGDLAVMLALSLAAVQIWNIRLSMEYQPAFILAFVFVPLFLLLERRGDQWLTGLSVASGTAVAFFDFLTTETVTILLPLALVVAVRAKENRLGSLKENLLLLLKCGICWAASYGGAYVVKWLIASMVTGKNAFSLALNSAGMHALGATTVNFDPQGLPNSWIDGLLSSLSAMLGSELRVDYSRIAAVLFAGFLIMFSVWYLLRRKKSNSVALPLMILGGLVLARFILLNNHTYMHCFFTYRALATLVFALLSAIWLNIELPQKKGRRK